MIRRRKRLGIAPESPASGARFVGWLLEVQDFLPEKIAVASLTKFYQKLGVLQIANNIVPEVWLSNKLLYGLLTLRQEINPYHTLLHMLCMVFTVGSNHVVVLHKSEVFYNFGAITAIASADVRTGIISKSTRSFQCSIHCVNR